MGRESNPVLCQGCCGCGYVCRGCYGCGYVKATGCFLMVESADRRRRLYEGVCRYEEGRWGV